MKALTTAGLTKLIQLIKSSFISNTDTVTTNTVTLATVATSGSYNDLSNRPNIPTATSDLTNDSGFITSSALSGYATNADLSYRAYSIIAEPTTDGGYKTATGTLSNSDYSFWVKFLARADGKWEDRAIYQLLNGVTGKIPDVRLSSNIARTANVADTDLSNVTDTGYIKMAGASIPSGTYDDLTLGASGAIYTAPANGWFYISKQGTAAGQQLVMGVKDTNNSTIYDTTCITATSANAVSGILPVKKGDRVEITYQTPGQLYNFRFIYAKGSESEAS